MSASRFACPCCGFLTWGEPPTGTFELCPVCFWEDDVVQSREPTRGGGANAPSLVEARHRIPSTLKEARHRTPGCEP